MLQQRRRRRAQVAAGEKQEEHTNPLEYILMLLSVGAASWAGGWRKAYAKADKGYVEPINAVAPPLYTRCSTSITSTKLYD